MTRDYFAGANTATGFVNHFSQIARPTTCKKIYLIKGGSGVGKSTSLKKISKYFETRGLLVENIWCGSDINSLDGLHVPDLQIAFFDATAPHTMEATIPMICEEIIDFAHYLDKNALVTFKDTILSLLDSKAQSYQRCYTFLKCAQLLRDSNSILLNPYINPSTIEAAAQDFMQQLSLSPKVLSASTRLLFGESFSCAGHQDITVNLFDDYTVYSTNQVHIEAHHIFLHTLQELLETCGYACDILLSCFDAKTMKTLLVPELKLAITDICNPYYSSIETTTWINDISNKHYAILFENNALITKLQTSAKESLKDALDAHMQIEAIYSSHMNFEACDHMIETLLTTLIGGEL